MQEEAVVAAAGAASSVDDKTRRIVVALYPFKAIETGDLSLEKVSVWFN